MLYFHEGYSVKVEQPVARLINSLKLLFQMQHKTTCGITSHNALHYNILYTTM